MPPRRVLRVAALQMNSRTNVAANLAQAATLIARAAGLGAQLVALPENALYIGPDTTTRFTLRSPAVRALADCATTHRLWLLVGSIQEAIPGSRQHYNTSLLYDPQGCLVARYRKIHLFRCRLPARRSGGGPSDRVLREPATRAGTRVVVAQTPFARLGLSICYDLRMPELYGTLARRGAQVLCVPSNFTAWTGRQHWHILLRARAIENQAFVIAPAQYGRKYHTGSYGHTLIVDPWGKILAEATTERPGVIMANLDLRMLHDCRTRLPALQDRF